MERSTTMLSDPNGGSEQARGAVYHNIFTRRDVRGQFLPDQVADSVLTYTMY